jgi:flavin-dependent dehydrogenase
VIDLRAPDRTSPGKSANPCDCFIVGGGPAGLAAAIALRQRGLDVVVVDALTPPIDKACGEGLMPDSRRELAHLGIPLDRKPGFEFSGIRFANPDREVVVTAAFASGKGIGIRRLDLHQLLIDHAQEVGVRLKWGHRVDFTSSPTAIVGDLSYCYRYLIGADGEASRVRRWAGLDAGTLRSERFGFRRHFRVRPWSSCVEVHWGRGCQAYVTPVGEDEICVAAITRQRGVHFDQVLEQIPWLHQRLKGKEAADRDRGAVTTTRRLNRVTCRNIALIGDASGSADAITGEGLAMAFRQASLLAESLEKDTLAHYEAGHARILQLPQRMAQLMMSMDRHDWFRDRVLRTLAQNPPIFAKMLAVHTGESTIASFLTSAGLPLVAGFLREGLQVRPNSASHNPVLDADFPPPSLREIVRFERKTV